jgi:hypothetical protein
MDRFGDTARKGFDFLKSRAKETVEVTKLSSNIRELEDRRDQCLLDIGHRVVAMFDAPVFSKEAVRDRVDEVRSLNAEIEAAQKDYEEVKTSLKSSVEEILPGSRSKESDHSHHATDAPPHGTKPPEYETFQ